MIDVKFFETEFHYFALLLTAIPPERYQFLSPNSCQNGQPRSMLINYGLNALVESDEPLYLWQCILLSLSALFQCHTPNCSRCSVQGDSLFLSVLFALLDYESRAQEENALRLLFFRVLRRELNPKNMFESIYWPSKDRALKLSKYDSLNMEGHSRFRFRLVTLVGSLTILCTWFLRFGF